jgi:hypothetical protein
MLYSIAVSGNKRAKGLPINKKHLACIMQNLVPSFLLDCGVLKSKHFEGKTSTKN